MTTPTNPLLSMLDSMLRLAEVNAARRAAICREVMRNWPEDPVPVEPDRYTAPRPLRSSSITATPREQIVPIVSIGPGGIGHPDSKEITL